MIREANSTDFESIFHLYKSYVLDVSRITEHAYLKQAQTTGFMIGLSGKVDLAKRIKTSTVFKIYERSGQILAYIDVNREVYFPEEADNIEWRSRFLKKTYFHSQKSITLHQIVVDPKVTRHGIAGKLLVDSLKELARRDFRHLFSIVTTGPVENTPSLKWHKKMKFTPACITHPIDLFGLKDYTSILFYKKV